MSIDADEWRSFFDRNFNQRAQRRAHLLKWLSLKWSITERMACNFHRFLSTMLFGTLEFHLRSDGFVLFGDQYPIRYDWLTAEDKRFCIRLHRLGNNAFAQCKEFQSGQIDFSQPLVKEDIVFSSIWRKQLVRDLAWIVFGLQNRVLISELIAAVQWLMIEKPVMNSFLVDLHLGLQGRLKLAEVLCIY